MMRIDLVLAASSERFALDRGDMWPLSGVALYCDCCIGSILRNRGIMSLCDASAGRRGTHRRQRAVRDGRPRPRPGHAVEMGRGGDFIKGDAPSWPNAEVPR